MLSPTTIIRNGLRRTPLRRAVMSYRHMGLTSSDVFLASYPRSGNTWLKSLLASCIFGEAMQNFSDTVNPVIPIVGFHHNVKPLLVGGGRIIKTHESFRKEYQRAIWIVRDPRDVVMSEYKLQLRSGIFSGSFDDYLIRFTTPEQNGPPDWQTYTRSWMGSSLIESSSLLTIRFEDMRSNVAHELKRVLMFLKLPSNETIIETAMQQNSLRSMAERHAQYDQTLGNAVKAKLPAVNKGLAGGWQSELKAKQIELIETSFGKTMDLLGYERSVS